MKHLYMVALILLCACQTPQQKCATTSDAELKLRHAQLVNYLTTEKGSIKIDTRSEGWKLIDDERTHRIKEKEAIETELFRRWKAGDKDAWLPLFDSQSHD